MWHLSMKDISLYDVRYWYKTQLRNVVRSRFNTGFTQKTWLHHWRPYVSERKNKSLSSPLPPILHISHKHVWATQNSFFLVCTCEHIAPLNTALCCPRGRGAGHWRVCVSVCARVCVCAWGRVKERRKHTAHKRSFHPSRVHRVSLDHRNRVIWKQSAFLSSVGESV